MSASSGPVAKEVVPDKAIEIVGSGDTRINLVVGDFRFLRYPAAQLLSNLRGALQVWSPWAYRE